MDDRTLKLGVNIDHVATLRNARRTCYPSVLEAAALCERAGAHGITIHLREDRRHIKDEDVCALRKSLGVRMNLEMANNPEIVAIAVDVRPDEVCLVPERREELTTEGGLDVAGQAAEISATVKVLTEAGIIVSCFIDPDENQVRASAEAGAPVIELHTGTYCEAMDKAVRDGSERAEQDSMRELDRLIGSAVNAHELGLKVNAGHGINLDNIDGVLKMPHLDTLNIGHSIVAHAVFVGLERAVQDMLAKMNG